MVDVDALTDAELRTKLIEYGFPVMPITGTTRKVMAKKLKLLMENKNKPTSDRRSLAQFSSEEESDSDSIKPVVSKKEKNRRVTMAVVPPMQPPVSTKVSLRKNSRRVENDDVIESPKVTSKEERKSRAAKIMVALEKDLDTNSDSEPDIVEKDYKVASTRNHYEEKKESPGKSISSTTLNYTRQYSPPKQSDVVTSFASNRYSTYASPSSASIDAAEKLNQIRSRLSLTSPGYETSYASTLDTNAETPFLSNFTKRLSQLSHAKGEPDHKSESVIKESDSNGSGAYNRTYMNRPKPREYSRDYQVNQERAASRGNYISVLLVGGVALFFVVLTALYWGMHSGNNNNEIIGLMVPYCNKLDSNAKIGENCIIDADLQGALDIYKVIKPQLIKVAIAHKCTDPSTKPYMTERDVVDFIKSNYALQDEFVILQDLKNFVILLYKNAFWEVSVLQSSVGDFTARNQVDNLEAVFVNKRAGFKTALSVLEPSLPLKCSLYIQCANFMQVAVSILAAAGVLWCLKKGFTQYRHHEQRKKDEIVLMVERIIDILQTNATEETDHYLVINHVRDMILPIDNRKKMEQTWLQAVKFINENESRVRTEVQLVKGEPYEVWRWVGGLNTSSARNKSWQGQAFETNAGSVNSPPCSPTPCLKIRGMVDEGDRNLHTIKEAVLVKCAEHCRILHCAVDVNSKCVYLKCADQNDAAVAYRNLHGWWYASHLVTVKYLRLERYMQRFPDSPQSGPPFLKSHAK